MKVYAAEERRVKVAQMLAGLRATGFTTKEVIEARKWKELSEGGKMTVRVRVYELTCETGTFYVMSDTLDRVMSGYEEDLNAIVQWLNENGFYTDAKEFYQKEMGMTEDTWEEWNS